MLFGVLQKLPKMGQSSIKGSFSKAKTLLQELEDGPHSGAHLLVLCVSKVLEGCLNSLSSRTLICWRSSKQPMSTSRMSIDTAKVCFNYSILRGMLENTSIEKNNVANFSATK